MLQTRRLALRATRQIRSGAQKRYESGHGHASHGEATPRHSNPIPQEEHFGRNFYLTLAAIPLGFALYKFTADSKEGPSFTRLIERYSEYKEQWTARNTLHTTMIEQAAHDRNLFQSSPGSKMIDLKFPETFNTGSPYNVPAGHHTDLSALIKHYEDKNRETDEAVREKLAAKASRS